MNQHSLRQRRYNTAIRQWVNILGQKTVMPSRLQAAVPWGRNFDEYCRMFSLSREDLAGSILGCADGPASFNAEFTRQGGRVVSVDPLYEFSAADIRRRIDEVRPEVMAQTREFADRFVWTSISSVEHLNEIRTGAMDVFLDDFPQGLAEGRYVHASLPKLPFADGQFDLALCSHYLFTYSHVIDEQAHLHAAQELCRVAKEVRIFPLLDLEAVTSAHLKGVRAELCRNGLLTRLVDVAYEFQKGGNKMLQLTRKA
jgi:hypothetical protein